MPQKIPAEKPYQAFWKSLRFGCQLCMVENRTEFWDSHDLQVRSHGRSPSFVVNGEHQERLEDGIVVTAPDSVGCLEPHAREAKFHGRIERHARCRRPCI